ncbi:hypothetical protein LX36DRAFT_69594 [Colletotrichum falcatum]|nr:hypothetical protein LX36DRAFT_69594 [Colletotrichum falcatum]
MNPGTPFIPLRPISPQGNVTGPFPLSNGNLVKANPDFFGGRAGFCQDANGQVFCDVCRPRRVLPSPGRAPVRLGSILASSCPNGAVVSRPVGTAPQVADPTAVAVDDGTPTLRPGLYTRAGFVSSPAASCRIATESWVFGQATLPPARVSGGGGLRRIRTSAVSIPATE